MHHLFFEKKIKEKVNQVVTIILILLYESMLFTNPTRLPLVSLHTSLCVWLNVYCQPPDPMSHQSCHPSLDLLYKIAKFICLQHDITGIQEVLPRPQTKRLLRILTTHHFLAVTTHSLCAAHTTHFPDSWFRYWNIDHHTAGRGNPSSSPSLFPSPGGFLPGTGSEGRLPPPRSITTTLPPALATTPLTLPTAYKLTGYLMSLYHLNSWYRTPCTAKPCIKFKPPLLLTKPAGYNNC